MFLPDESFMRAARTSTTLAPGVRVELERHPRLAEHADGLLRAIAMTLAAGDDRRERARDLRPRSRALQAAVDDGDTLREARAHARRGRRCVQQDGRFARAPGARPGAALRAARDHRDRAARAPADRAPDATARSGGARRAGTADHGSRPSRPATTPREPGTSTAVDAFTGHSAHRWRGYACS